jgi:hypothetical protein
VSYFIPRPSADCLQLQQDPLPISPLQFVLALSTYNPIDQQKNKPLFPPLLFISPHSSHFAEIAPVGIRALYLKSTVE